MVTFNLKKAIMQDKQPPAPRRKAGSALSVGDVIRVWCGTYTITSFTDHPGLTSGGKFYPARIANSGDWGMTIFDDELWVEKSPNIWEHR